MISARGAIYSGIPACGRRGLCSMRGEFHPYPRASKPQKQALYDVIALRLRCNRPAFTA